VTLIAWGIVAFIFFAALHYWLTNVKPRKDWNADAYAVTDASRFATGYNRLTESALRQVMGGGMQVWHDGDAA
jgi:hypothetical protein